MSSEEVWVPYAGAPLEGGYYDVQVRGGTEYIGCYLNPRGSFVSGKGKVTSIEPAQVVLFRPTCWPAVFAARDAHKKS